MSSTSTTCLQCKKQRRHQPQGFHLRNGNYCPTKRSHSYPIVTEQNAAPPWLDADWLLSQFGTQRDQAIDRYRKFVMAGKGLPSALQQTRHQLVLGDDAFVERHGQKKEAETLREISKAHRKSVALTLDQYQMRHPNRDEAMAQAYLSGAYTMAEIGLFFGVHYMTVSRAVRKFEGRLGDDE